MKGLNLFKSAAVKTHVHRTCACSTASDRRGVVSVNGLRCHSFAGVYEAERQHGQKFECDVSVILTPEATKQTMHSDLLCDTVDFDSIANITDRVLTDRENPPYLLETLTRKLLDELSSNFCHSSPKLVDQIDVSIRKPQASAALFFDSIGVGASVDGQNNILPGSVYLSIDGLYAHSFIGDIPFEFDHGRKVGLSNFRGYYRNHQILDECNDDYHLVLDYVELANTLNDFLTVPKSQECNNDSDSDSDGGGVMAQQMRHCQMVESAYSSLESFCLYRFGDKIDRCHFEIIKYHPGFVPHCKHVSYTVI